MSRSFGGRSFTTWPSIFTVPAVTVSRPATMRSAVVFPQPDGPTKTTNSPSPTSRSKSVNAFVPSGYTFVSFSSVISAIHLSLSVGAHESTRRWSPSWGAFGEGMHQATWSTRTVARLDCLGTVRGGRDAQREGPQREAPQLGLNRLGSTAVGWRPRLLRG